MRKYTHVNHRSHFLHFFFYYNTYINSMSIYIQNKIIMILNLSHDIIMLNYLRQTTSDVTYHIVYIVSLLDACKHTHTHTHFPTFHFNIFSTCFGMLHECDRKNFSLIIDCVMIVHIHRLFYTKTHLIQWKLKIFLHHTFVSVINKYHTHTHIYTHYICTYVFIMLMNDDGDVSQEVRIVQHLFDLFVCFSKNKVSSVILLL